MDAAVRHVLRCLVLQTLGRSSSARSAVQLTLDDVFRSRATLPGDFGELNVDVGVRLGDVGEARPSTTTTQPSVTSFRGCLRSVVFNDVDVLAASRRARWTAVSWDRSEPPDHK